MRPLIQKLNIFEECGALHWKLSTCPPFLFLIMGIVTICSIIITYLFASRLVTEPEVAALLVIGIAVLFLIVGSIIINGFNRIAEANRMKSEFIAIVSHQLRSPLSVFKWTLDVLVHEIDKGRDLRESENFIHTLRSTTESMIILVNSLLEISRIESGTLVLRNEPLSLEEVTKSVVKDFERYAQASNVRFVLAVPPALPPVIADRERLTMVIQNLIDNAVRYTPRSGTIMVTIAAQGTSLYWELKDEGVGIPASEQKYIFRKFFRAHNAASNQTRGSGIGLYISKAIIEAFGGYIGFHSDEGKGSTFYFTIPTAKS